MKIKTELYEYQKKAVEKLLPIKVGALFMEMGTGKTRTALELIFKRIEAGKLEHVLWLCPCSVRDNLKEDIYKHTDGGLAQIAVYGIESLSSNSRLYEQLIKYVQAKITMLVVDESILTKNTKAIRTQRIIHLSSFCKYRIILNGTPIGRNEADLFGQFYILDWRILGYRSYWAFAANHLEYDEKYKHKIRRVLNVEYLTDKIAPYSYIIRKDDAIKLPCKYHSKYDFSISEEQRRHYYNERDKFLDTLIDNDDEAAIYRTFTALQEIASGRRIISEANEPIKHEAYFKKVSDNPRIVLLQSIIEDDNNKEKTIIWCKFQHEIDDIQIVLTDKYGEENVRIFCGKLSHKKRTEALKDFANKSRFLIANKTCAGFGLNLQFCHRAIYYNNDWNWATRQQSEDRLHRIGQNHEIKIIDIYAYRTIDSRILQCLLHKENLVEKFKTSMKGKNIREWLDGEDIGEDDILRPEH